MDRGTSITDACRAHLQDASLLDIRQTRRGWIQECLGCQAKTEFKYFNADKTQIAHSLEEANCFCRIFCSPIHPYTMRVQEMATDAELLSVDRPCSCCAGPCKCCCFQSATFSSNSNPIGSIHETCYFCVPMFQVRDPSGATIYKIHPPTCCPGGCCVHCCTEGDPCCGRGCCVVPFWIFDSASGNTNGSNAPHVGKIVKRPKSIATEIFTDANAFDVQFPPDASAEKKAMLVGSSIFLNAIFLNAIFFEAKSNS